MTENEPEVRYLKNAFSANKDKEIKPRKKLITHHSTETAVTNIISDLVLKSDANKICILVLLDLDMTIITPVSL